MVREPFESTGDGSTCVGYGLAGGASDSEGPEDLCDISSGWARNIHAVWIAYLFELGCGKVLGKGAGELGESEYGEKEDARPAVGEGMSGLFNAMMAACDDARW